MGCRASHLERILSMTNFQTLRALSSESFKIKFKTYLEWLQYFFLVGEFLTTMLGFPHRKPLTLVVGSPIPLEKNPNPTAEHIHAVHEKYMDALVNLYDEYNPIYGDTNVKL